MHCFANDSWSYLEKQWASQCIWDVNLVFKNLKRISPERELNEASLAVPKSHVTQSRDMNN